MSNFAEDGYVRLVDNLGDELTIVNAARASFAKESNELSEKDIKLIKFLVKHRHDSTLRHNVMTFEVKAPLMIARQWYKHAIASTHLDEQFGWNESSRRYITENNSYYLPNWNEWRYAADDRKQGSSDKEMDKDLGVRLSLLMSKHIDKSEEIYNAALAEGVAPEQARLFIPAYALNVNWRWTVSLNAVLHFIHLRKHESAQSEIRKYADEVERVVRQIYPNVMEAWNERMV